MIPRRRCRCKRRNGKILRRGVIPTKKNGPFPYNGRKNGVPCILVHKRQGRRELYGDRSHKRGPESAAGDEGGAGPPRGPDALRELELSIDAALPKKLVLDLAGVTFMDSSGIALILRAQQRMQLLDGSLLVRNVPQQARRVLDAAGIGRLVTIR